MGGGYDIVLPESIFISYDGTANKIMRETSTDTIIRPLFIEQLSY
jgi:hypothetical protein